MHHEVAELRNVKTAIGAKFGHIILDFVRGKFLSQREKTGFQFLSLYSARLILVKLNKEVFNFLFGKSIQLTLTG